MDRFTLTEMTDIIGRLDGLPIAATRTLHRQLKGLAAHGLLHSSGAQGSGEKAPAIFSLHELAKARVMAKLLSLNVEVKALRLFFAAPDHRSVPNEVRFASGLENAIAAALDGIPCVVHFDIMNHGPGVRARFQYDGDAAADPIASNLIHVHDAVTGMRVVGSLTLFIKDIVDPLIGESDAIDASPINDLPAPPAMPTA